MSQSAGRTVAKNAGVLMVSKVLTWAMALMLTVLVPRYLGASGIGHFHLANSLWAIAAIIASFGIDTLLIKEIARNPQNTDAMLGTSLVLRTALFALTALGMAVYLVLVDYPAEMVLLIVTVGAATLLSQYVSSWDAAFRGLERMEFISVSDIVVKAVATVLAVVVMLRGHGIVALALTGVLSTAINLLLLVWFLRRMRSVWVRWDGSTARWMLRSSYPYLFVNIWLVLYLQIDVIIISLLADEKTVGWYGAADRLFGALLFVPTVLITAVFPALSRMHHDAPASSGRLFNKSFDLLLLVGVPIGLGMLTIARPLAILLFGAQFAQSGPVLALFGLVLIFTYQNALLGQYFISIDRQRYWTRVIAAATITTVVLDLVLIPWSANKFGNGAIGGVLAFVVTESGMLAAGLAQLPSGTLAPGKLWLAGRIVMSGLLMSVAAALTLDHFIALPIVVGAAVYLLCIVVFRVVPAEDWALLRQMRRYAVMRISGHAAVTANQ